MKEEKSGINMKRNIVAKCKLLISIKVHVLFWTSIYIFYTQSNKCLYCKKM